MYFCYRYATDFRTNPPARLPSRLRLVAATCDRWTRDDAAGGHRRVAVGLGSEMLCYPHVFWCDGHAYMLYNGNAFGRHGFGVR